MASTLYSVPRGASTLEASGSTRLGGYEYKSNTRTSYTTPSSYPRYGRHLVQSAPCLQSLFGPAGCKSPGQGCRITQKLQTTANWN